MKGIVKFEEIHRFDVVTDVVVAGYGGAGGCAALEARRAGSEVLVLERASGAGGSTMMSACEMYLEVAAARGCRPNSASRIPPKISTTISRPASRAMWTRRVCAAS